MIEITEVSGGRFYCSKCGASFVGTWHGPKELMTCIVCKQLLFEQEKRELAAGGETDD